MKDWEQEYDDLLYKYNVLKRDYENLQEKYNKAYDDLSSANFKIRTELEPRIQSERRAYDRYITDPER